MRVRVLSAILLFIASISSAAAVEVHVSVNGEDSAAGTAVAPFRTLERARDELRRLKARDAARETATVVVHGGTYYLSRTFELGPVDSGTSNAPVVYRAYKQDRVALVGGRAVSGFAAYRGSILKADVGALGITNYFRQLFFDDQRQILARYPNFDPDHPCDGGWAYGDGKTIPMYKNVLGEPRNRFEFCEQDARTWARPEEGEVFVFPRYNWWNNIVRIKAVDSGRRVITLAGNASYAIRPGDRYYVQNLFEELDAPGEWYLDRRTHMLYFWPPAATDGKTVCVPTLRTLLYLSAGTSCVTFRGFTFECCEGNAISLQGTTNCLIAGNVIRNVGDYEGNGVAVEGGCDNGIVGNDIYAIGSRGIYLEGGDFGTLTPGGNYADNNYIHHTGVYYKQGAGISLHGVGNRASHNLIHDEPRYGIEFSGNDHVIEFNHIRHVNLETADTGAIESWNVSWARRGTVIRFNYLHDVLGFGQENGHWTSPHFAWGIYLDDGTTGTHVYGNIVARAPLGGVHIHGGRDNVIENNIFVDGASQQVTYTGYGPKSDVAMITKNTQPFLDNPIYLKKYPEMTHLDLKTAWRMSGTKFLRNIISYRDPKAVLSKFTNLPFEETESDYNVFYHFGLPLQSDGKIPPGEEAAAKQLDRHSTNADPLFMAPERDDYRLREGSPALKLGFEPIPVEKIGPYADPLRVSWPIVEAHGVR